jgi:hypothetical protein
MSGSPPQPAPPFAFNRLAELPPGESIIGAVYGSAGNGKTWFLGTGGDRHLIIDTGDTGMETLKSKLFKEKVKANPIIVSVNEKLGLRGNVDTATAYDAVCDIIDWAVANKRSEFDIISVNDITRMNAFAMNKGLEVGLKLGKSFSKKRAEEYDAVDYAVQDYKMEMDLMNKFIAGTKSICVREGLHFFIAAHQRLTYRQARDKNNNPILGEAPVVVDTRLGFRGKTFPDEISGYFDLIWHLEAVGSGDNIVYRARTSGGEDITARTNFGGLFPTIIKNPNLLETIQLIQQSRKHPEKR